MELSDVGPEVRIVEHAPGEPSVEAAEPRRRRRGRVLALTEPSTKPARGRRWAADREVIIGKHCSCYFRPDLDAGGHLWKNAREVLPSSSDSTMPVLRAVRKQTIPPPERARMLAVLISR